MKKIAHSIKNKDVPLYLRVFYGLFYTYIVLLFFYKNFKLILYLDLLNNQLGFAIT